MTRHRLLETLGSEDGGPLIVVTGPAGAGKTVLVRSWLETLERGTWAWIAADPEDRTSERFWSTVSAAVMAQVPEMGGAALDLLATGATGQAAKRSLLRDLTDWCGGRAFVIVIDDYHLLASAEVDAQVTYFVEHLPDSCRFVVTSRGEPRLALGRLRVRGELTEVRGVDLAFRPTETADFFAAFEPSSIDRSTTDGLTARTDGWAAGLQLAALAMRRAADPAEFLARFGGSNSEVASFLLEEVLDRQEPAVRSFLLATSILSSFNPELAAAVTGDPESARILRHLDGEELFVLPLDGADGWYRYHHLFGELLLRELCVERPDDVLSLRGRAAKWLAGHGQPAEAVEQALAAGDRSAALELVRDHHTELANRGDSPLVLRVLDDLHESELVTDPDRAVELVSALGFAGMPGAALVMLERLKDALPATTSSSTLGRLALAGALSAAGAGHLEEAIRLGGEAKEHFGGALPGNAAGVRLPLFLGRCFTLAERFDEAHTHLREARRRATHGSLPAWVVDGSIAQALLHEGRLHEAKALADAAIERWRGDGAPANPAASDALRARAALHAEAGEYSHAWHLLDEAASAIAAHARSGTTTTVLTVAARADLLRATGSPAEALETLSEIDGGWEHYPPGPLLDSVLAEVEAVAAITCDDLARAERASRRLVGSAAVIMQARISLARGGAESVAAALDELSADAPPVRRIQAQLILGSATRDDPDRAAHHIQSAVHLALDAGYAEVLLLDRGLLPLLDSYAQRTSNPNLNRVLQRADRRGLRAALPGTPERPTAREMDLLRLLPTHLSNQELSTELAVSLNTVKSHLKSLYRKLGADCRSDAVARARSADLIPR
ncbi:hypothetical protein BH10ACT1_BH10ACT1_11720 [soil metagenome]